ncbi:Rpi1p KNAG_0E01830 [Huiozyma naganishii CBS 8797]|uniref:Myb-like domain-containing protein n=1 Tax=Huiozyma naganishii (strain ATCC MYA-139 / BCRC 22969 / CBS 8797 / KCTC 17520 / NBRC 10181 / NCYC 3082 / Yp74L-3) TaxID=1071383 RepID=J7R6G9_HUIN7|nr:hypothetical protein KNAG_0E01830 [Kazachstania naganishii CBS 8797]CCK70445.1 hypothetical protein KNAG_0E01830 [Kazachstania naganishii CBS 8797]
MDTTKLQLIAPKSRSVHGECNGFEAAFVNGRSHGGTGSITNSAGEYALHGPTTIWKLPAKGMFRNEDKGEAEVEDESEMEEDRDNDDPMDGLAGKSTSPQSSGSYCDTGSNNNGPDSHSRQFRKKWRDSEDIAFVQVLLDHSQLLNFVEFFKPMKNFWIQISEQLLQKHNFERNARQCQDRFKLLYTKGRKLEQDHECDTDIRQKPGLSQKDVSLVQLVNTFELVRGNLVLKTNERLNSESNSSTETCPEQQNTSTEPGICNNVENNDNNDQVKETINHSTSPSGSVTVPNGTISNGTISNCKEEMVTTPEKGQTFNKASKDYGEELTLLQNKVNDISLLIKQQLDQQNHIQQIFNGHASTDQTELELELRREQENLRFQQTQCECQLMDHEQNIATVDGHMLAHSQQLESQDDRIEMAEHVVSSHDKIIEEHDNRLLLQERQLTAQESELVKQSRELWIQNAKSLEQEEVLTQHHKRLTGYKKKLTNHDRRLSQCGEKLSNHDGQLSNLDGQLFNHDGQLSKLDGQVSNLDGQLSNLDSQLSSQLSRCVEKLMQHDTQISMQKSVCDNLSYLRTDVDHIKTHLAIMQPRLEELERKNDQQAQLIKMMYQAFKDCAEKNTTKVNLRDLENL